MNPDSAQWTLRQAAIASAKEECARGPEDLMQIQAGRDVQAALKLQGKKPASQGKIVWL